MDVDNLDPEEIVSAVNEATRRALLEHKRAGNSVALWREGRVVIVRPEDIEVPAPSSPS